jgi:hypothetical protein
MAEFNKARKDLVDSRADSTVARMNLFAGDERLRMMERELEALNRQKGDNNVAFLDRKRELERKISEERQKQNRNRENLVVIDQNLAEAGKLFEVFTDPRQELASHFPVDTPFLMFPLRLETRFKTLGIKRQLWVRVYPDECMTDSFEPLLSQKEVNNAARFWAEFYSAGLPSDPNNPEQKILDNQKAAWRLLVQTQGDGRAAWITRQLRPDDTSVFPIRRDKTHILSIVTDTWNAAQAAVITGLFNDLWFANGNEKVIQQVKLNFDTNNPMLKAEDVINKYEPVNFYDKLPQELKREEASLAFAIVIFPDLATKAGKINSWTQSSKVRILPEKLALIRVKNGNPMVPIFGNNIPFPLPTSPDPTATEADQFKLDSNNDLEFAEAVKWVADFDVAISMGLGFKVDLAADEVNGFEKLLVLGVKLGADQEEGRKQVEELFEHHYFSRKGFSIIPQGTPTNNTGTADSGYSTNDFSDQSFDLYFQQKPGFSETNIINQRKDGQWLAEWLGLDYSVFKKVLNSGGSDQSDARNMNTALWPATLGYVMSSVMESGFSDQTIAQVRNFFNNHVSGRGPLPAIRIGNQPYGLLATTAFRRLTWMGRTEIDAAVTNTGSNFLLKLYAVLIQIENYFQNNLLSSVSTMTNPSSKPGQTLLDVLSLHPNSVEFFRRYMESLDAINNAAKLVKSEAIEGISTSNATMQLLMKELSYTAEQTPLLAMLLGMPLPEPIKILIDDVPLSESKAIRSYTSTNKNYITALVEQARESQNAVRTGKGFSERPTAELYRLLKYAIEQSYHNSGLDAVATTNVFSTEKLAFMKTEQPFVHQQWKGQVTESRYSLLYSTLKELSPEKTVSEFIRDSMFLPTIPAFSRYLSSQLTALEQLQNTSTARLERALVEHIDCCSYRLDSWKTGLLTTHLMGLRNNAGGVTDGQRKTGIYIGAFGWLENVRPETKKILSEKEIPQDVRADFNPEDTKVFYTDSENEGFIHAPSLNQAVTSAVLRNGYISHGKEDSNSVLAVNLTSDRIRQALQVIEGIQNGQSLAALLGYQLERELHDKHNLTGKSIDTYIYKLRREFPLNADQLKDTQVKNNTDPSVDPETIPITAIEARNVVHGVNLVNHVKKSAVKTYPYGLNLTNDDPAITSAITKAVKNIVDVADAVGDLGIAESVHQIVMGNYDRAAGVLESYSKGNYPQTPDVIKTPRSGATLTHRVGIPFSYMAMAAVGSSPRVQGEPSMNQWLSGILPPLNKTIVDTSFKKRSTGGNDDRTVNMQELGLTHLDLLYMVNTSDTGQLDEMGERIIHFLYGVTDPQLDADLKLNYTQLSANATNIPLFQLMPMLKSLRALLLQSPALTPGDLGLPNEMTKKDIPIPELPAQRLINIVNDLKGFLTSAALPANILGYLNGLPAKEAATPADLSAMAAVVDDTITRAANFLLGLAKFGVPQTSSGSLYVQRQTWFTSLKKKLQEYIDRWQKNSDDFVVLAGNPTPAAEDLQNMERLIMATASPLGTATIGSVNTQKAFFDVAFNNLKTVNTNRQATIIQVINEIRAIDTTPFDLATIDVTEELKQIIFFIYDLKARAKSIADELNTKKIPKVEAMLIELPTFKAEDQPSKLEEATRVILGEAFKMIPRYPLPATQQAELSNSWNATSDLLNYSITTGQRTNPQEDWLHGIARVHEKMKHLENCLFMREAFGLNESDLAIHPVQLPFKTEKYHWMALPFPVNEVDMETNNILDYTAFINEAAIAPNDVCGVLADEWNETIPTIEETTGITFHYDRPNCEAPQTMLLVTPTKVRGNWEWNDLVDALLYTMDAAKLRAIEPDQIDTTPFASLLPAIVAAESLHPYSIVLDHPAHYLTLEVINDVIGTR